MARILPVAIGIALMIVTIQGAAVPTELQVPGKAARAACIEATSVTNEAIEKASVGDFEDDDKLKCYFKCIFEKFELIADDIIDYEKMLKLVPESIKESGTDMVQSCRNEPGADLCEKSFNINKCFYKHDPETYFVI